MGAELGVVGGQFAIESVRERRRDRWFFTAMAVAALLTVFTGFAPSYYLGRFFEAPPLSTLVHIHGVLFTSWILLFLTQTSLIAARRADLHRRLGVAGGALALLMLVVGYLTAVEAARRGVTPPGCVARRLLTTRRLLQEPGAPAEFESKNRSAGPAPR